MSGALDHCPACGLKILDTDGKGMEADDGQRWCQDHHRDRVTLTARVISLSDNVHVHPGSHVRVGIYAGRRNFTRANLGFITFRLEEWQELAAQQHIGIQIMPSLIDSWLPPAPADSRLNDKLVDEGRS